jgi:hypothetical protein
MELSDININDIIDEVINYYVDKINEKNITINKNLQNVVIKANKEHIFMLL